MTRIVRIIVGSLGVAYLVTSVIVMINGFVWLPSFPSLWYGMQNILYWPFQPYFDWTVQALGSSDIPYNIYAIATRVPFVLVSLGVLKVVISRHAK